MKKNFILILPPILILMITALLYSNSVFNDFLSFDDKAYIIDNHFIRDFSLKGIKIIFSTFYFANYHPFTTLVYLFEYKLFALNPLPYHLLNVLLHLLNTWLVFRLAETLSGKKTVAIIVALLFAIHPMQVETVAWVSELKNLMYSLFYLLALLYYLRYLKSGLKRKYFYYVLLLFFASLLSKSAAVTLPVTLMILDFYKGRKINKQLFLEKIPFLILSIFFGILTIISQRQNFYGSIAYNGLIFHTYSFNGMFINSFCILFYIFLLIFPFKLSAIHPFPQIVNGLLPWQYYTSFALLSLIFWLITKKGKYRKELIFGFSFYLITISVMLQFFSFGSSLVSERYIYLSSFGLFYIFAQWLSDMLKIYSDYIVIILFGTSIIFFIISWKRINIWKNNSIFFNDLVNKNPDYPNAYLFRGDIETKQGNFNSAIADYSEAIRLNINTENVFYNRGCVYMKTGNDKLALDDFKKALFLNPRMADCYNNMGWIEDKSGQAKLALYNYDKAIMLDPKFVKAYYNRANLKGTKGDYNGALSDYNFILKIDSFDNIAYYYRGLCYFELKINSEACKDWQKSAAYGNEQAINMLNAYCH